MSILIENSWILISGSTANLFQYVVLVEAWGRKCGLTQIHSWKMGDYFNCLFRLDKWWPFH